MARKDQPLLVDQKRLQNALAADRGYESEELWIIHDRMTGIPRIGMNRFYRPLVALHAFSFGRVPIPRRGTPALIIAILTVLLLTPNRFPISTVVIFCLTYRS